MQNIFTKLQFKFLIKDEHNEVEEFITFWKINDSIYIRTLILHWLNELKIKLIIGEWASTIKISAAKIWFKLSWICSKIEEREKRKITWIMLGEKQMELCFHLCPPPLFSDFFYFFYKWKSATCQSKNAYVLISNGTHWWYSVTQNNVVILAFLYFYI